MGSSVIFLVVIAIWAAFLLPDLQLRRHHLAESRAASRILGASRTIARAGRKTDRDEVGHDAVHSESHSVAGESPLRAGAVATAKGAEAGSVEAAPETATGEREPAEVTTSSPKTVTVAATPARAGSRRGGRSRAARVARLVLAWVLALLLFVAVIAVPTTVVLSVLKVVPWWSVGVAFGAVVVMLGVMRARVVLRRRARRRSGAAPVATSGVQSSVPGVTAKASSWKGAARFGTKPGSSPAAAEPAKETVIDLRDTVVDVRDVPTKVMATVSRRDVAFDQDAEVEQARAFDGASDEGRVMDDAPRVVHGPTAPPTVALPVVDDRPGQWTPQQLPRPTYLMKPKAPEGPLAAPSTGAAIAHDPFSDLLSGDQDDDLPQARAV